MNQMQMFSTVNEKLRVKTNFRCDRVTLLSYTAGTEAEVNVNRRMEMEKTKVASSDLVFMLVGGLWNENKL